MYEATVHYLPGCEEGVAGDCSPAPPSARQRASPAERDVRSHSPSMSVYWPGICMSKINSIHSLYIYLHIVLNKQCF
jgi:hypothetical protein